MVNVMQKSVLTLLALLIAPSAFAHAFLVRALPAVGSTVSAAPSVLTLFYTEKVEPHFSQVQVLDAKGDRLPVGALHTTGDGRTVTIGLPKLSAGKYTVVWHVTSVDTHKTQGRFAFSVGP